MPPKTQAPVETPTPTPETPKKEKKEKVKRQPRKVIYEKVSTRLCVGEKGITSEVAMGFLGWCEDEKVAHEKGLNEAHYEIGKRKIWFLNNTNNRPIYKGIIKKLMQEVLRGFWIFNGETTIIGKTGLVLNNQHTLISVVLAEEERSKQELYYDDVWSGPISIDKLVVFGVDETDEVINTLDTCQSRSLADVIYRSPYFAKYHTGVRRHLSHVMEIAVKEVWFRTGIDDIVLRTHAEAIDWLERHSKLFECAIHVNDENDKKSVAKLIRLGHAAAYMYLMGTSDTSDEDYHALPVEERSEKMMDMGKWTQATEFWVMLSKGVEFQPVRDAFGSLVNGGLMEEKIAIISKAWKAYVEKGKVTKKDVDLTKHYSELDPATQTRSLMGIPLFGGIDLGDKEHRTPDLDDGDGKDVVDEPSDVEVTEVETAKEEVRNGKHKGKKASGKAITPSLEGRDSISSVDWTWLDGLHDANPGVTILARSVIGNWVAWGPNGELVASITGRENKMNPKGVKCVSIKPSELPEITKALNKEGHKVGLAEESDGKWEITTFHNPSTVPV